jgi:hypothetical protein
VAIDSSASAPASHVSPGPPPSPHAVECPAGEAVLLAADTAVAVGKTAGAAVIGCSGPLSDVVWTQLGGAPVAPLAARTQVISFDPPEVGTYAFQVSYRQDGGALQNRIVTISAFSPPAGSTITVRGDQAVRERGNTSVRAWPTLAAGDLLAEITWQQLGGPSVELDRADPRRIVFKAPEVARDTALSFRATLRTTSGRVEVDDVLVVVENATPPAPDGIFARQHLSRVFPYRPASKYAGVLVPCVWSPLLLPSNGCPLSRLPLIAQETPPGQIPSVDQIMDRLLVSHDWMGANFEQYLLTQDRDGDFRRMFAAVTAVVIGAHVRPPIYYGATAAVYLDATDLWLTPGERDVIDEAPDYRSGFGNALTFSGLTRFTVDNSHAWTYYRPDVRVTRTLDGIANELGRVLYHELGHAADFFPPSVHHTLDPDKSPNDLYLVRFRAGQFTSSLLGARFPLNSAEMKALGQVLYTGAMPTDQQKSYQPAQVADFFRADLANDTYCYSSEREDLAMLVEEIMMAHRRGVRRDVAITNRYMAGLTSDQLVVAWGQRGRIADPTIKPRIKFVLGQLLPWLNPALVDALPPPVAMPVGGSWYATVQLPAPDSRADFWPSRSLEDDTRQLEQELTRRAAHLELYPTFRGVAAERNRASDPRYSEPR